MSALSEPATRIDDDDDDDGACDSAVELPRLMSVSSRMLSERTCAIVGYDD